MVLVETNPTSQTFGSFFELWLTRQEQYLHQLLHAAEGGGGERRCSDLIHEIKAHYAQYFEAKAKLVEEDVFLVLAPTWLSLVERAHLWIGGFRPGMACRLVGRSVVDLSEEQFQRISRLTSEINEEEHEIMDELIRVQEEMVCSTMILAMHEREVQNGEKNKLESAIDRLKVSMQIVVECADLLRKKIAVMLLEILNPTQAVRFLAAVADLQLGLRRWGMRTDLYKA